VSECARESTSAAAARRASVTFVEPGRAIGFSFDFATNLIEIGEARVGFVKKYAILYARSQKRVRRVVSNVAPLPASQSAHAHTHTRRSQRTTLIFRIGLCEQL
jgi:hypothetical protein